MGTVGISWKRIFVEGGAIVVSILLAFAIDAWWEQRQVQVADRAHLNAVLDELGTHKHLIAEAIRAHRTTVENGTRLLEIIALNPGDETDAEIPRLLNGMINFYVINAPFGALETAVSSGAIARMRNTELAISLVSWPTAIDDLLEEEVGGSNVVLSHFLPVLSKRMPLASPYRLRLQAPNVRGMDDVVQLELLQLPESPHTNQFGPLREDHEVENVILLLMAWAQSAQAEAKIFGDNLDELVAELETCLQDSSC